MRKNDILSEELKRKAHFTPGGEACWSGSDIQDALREIANSGRLILGFDILEPMSDGRVKDWGRTHYAIDDRLRQKTWEERIAISLDLATKCVLDTKTLTGGLEPPYDDLWYCVSSVDILEEKRLKLKIKKLARGDYS
jgi:hypothetical protein